MYAHIVRTIIYIIVISFFSNAVFAQEKIWQSLGPREQDQVSSNYTDAVKITLSPAGVPYVITSDSKTDGRVVVKKFVNGKWEIVGNAPVSEDFTLTAFLTFSPDGSLYATYQCVIEGPATRVNVRKLVNNRWVSVGKAGINADLSPSLTFAADGTPYMAFSSNYYNFGGVVVRKFEAGQWNLVGTTGINSISVKTATDNRLVSYNGEFYLAYSDLGISKKIVVKKFVKGYWMTLGAEGFSDGEAIGIDMCFSKTGILHVIYQDVANGDKITVKKFENDQWVTVGKVGLSKGNSATPNILFTKDNTPIIFYMDISLGKKAVFGKYVNNVWELSEVTPNTSAYSLVSSTMRIDENDNIFVSYVDQSLNYRASVKKKVDNEWEGVGINGISPGGVSEVKIKTAQDNTPFLAYLDNEQSNASVKKYLNGAWQLVGSKTFTGINTKYIDLAIDQNSVPYLAFRDNAGVIRVKKFNGNWQDVGSALSLYTSSDCKIEIGADGNPIVGYVDQGNADRITVKKFDGTSWVTLGGSTASGNGASEPVIKVSKNGTLYVAYNDQSSFAKNTTLKRLINNAWVTVGIANFTNSNSISGLSLNISDDEVPYVAYCDGGNGNMVRVKKFSESAWTNVGSFLSAGGAKTTRMLFSKNGNPVVVYQNLESSQYDVKISEFKNEAWSSIATSRLTESATSFAEITMDKDGSMYSAFAAPQAYAAKLVPGNDLPPKLYSFEPLNASSREFITIKGDNFTNATTVKIGGKMVAGFKVTSPTEIVAEVATDQGSGDVLVVTPLGEALKGNFTFTQHPPIIAALSRLNGKIGESIDITGDYFSQLAADNIVYFGPVRAVVTAATNKSLRVIVPAFSAYNFLSVTVNKQTAYSPQPFLVKPEKSAQINAKTFANRKDFSTPSKPSMVKLGDIDGDGKADVVVTYDGSDLFSVFLNQSTSGTVAFAGAVSFGQGYSPRGLSIVDVDGDGKLDMLLANGYGASVVFFRNTSSPGSVSFSPPMAYGFNSYPYTTNGADMDQDGRPDLISSNINGTEMISVYRNVDFADSYLYTDNAVTITSFLWTGATVGDLNGDRYPEVLAATLGNIEVYPNISQPGKLAFKTKTELKTADSEPSVPIIADLDGDGKPEIITANNKVNKLSIFKNQSIDDNIAFAEKQLFAVQTGPQTSVAGDFNGDGAIDLFSVNRTAASISVLQNTSVGGNIMMADAVNFPVGKLPQSAVAGDVDGDGYTDIVVTNLLDNNFSVFRNTVGNTDLPINNFNIAVAGASCVGSNNGSITITANLSLNYVAELIDVSGKTEFNFNDQLKIEKLKAGTYTLNIYVKGEQDNIRSFTLNIAEPKALSVYTVVQADQSIVTLQLNGGSRYQIILNGKSYITTENSINLPLNNGLNNIEVNTGLDCQGIYQKTINFGAETKLYPNPVENTLSILLNKATAKNVSIRIYDVIGNNVFKQEYVNASSLIDLNLSSFGTGVYLMRINVDGTETQHKIIKK